MYVVLIYGLIVNVIGFIVMGADKMKAKRKSRRVPEKRLFLWAFLGGAAGVWIAMQVWRHKTKHESFTVGIPFIFYSQRAVHVFASQVVVLSAALNGSGRCRPKFVLLELAGIGYNKRKRTTGWS